MKKKLVCLLLASAMMFNIVGTNIGPAQVQAAVTTQNVNHVRSATMSASSVEDNAATVVAAKAGDGDVSTRWASNKGNPSTEWLKADFGEATLVKQIRIKLETRTSVLGPSNVHKFSIKYTNAAGEEKYIVENYENAVSGEGYVTDIIYNLEEAVEATSITICEFMTKASGWDNVSILEVEAYSNEIAADAILTVQGAAAHLEALPAEDRIVAADAETFTLPSIEGYTITLNGADFEQIIGKDLKVVHPLTDKTVKVSYVVTDAQGETAQTGDIAYTVKGKNTQAEGMNAKPVIIPEIQEWYSDTTDTLAVSSLTKVTYNDDSLEAIVDEFIADYKDFTGITLEKTKDDAKANAFNFTKEAPDALLGEEGYTMDILADRVNVASESITGNMYGMQTILQMYKQNNESFSVGTMRDYPRFEVRGFMLDIARKPVGMEMVHEIARTMRYYKMNDFQLHLSDNYIFLEDYGCRETENEAFKAYEAYRLECDVTNEAGESPTAKDYFITKDEMRTFIQSQRAMGMNIVPEIDLPAHATSFTKIWPELMVQGGAKGNRPLVDHFDITKPEAVEQIKAIFDDYTTGENPTFDSETVVHVGADEFEYNKTSYREFFNEIVPHVKQTNSQVRIWGSLSVIDDGKTQIIPEAIENVAMNIWNNGWANGQQMYNLGFKLINTLDGPNYMVPNGGMGRGAYGDLLNHTAVFNFEPNVYGGVTLPTSDDQILGSVYAIWNDNIDKKSSGLTDSDLYWRFFDALPLYAEKNWAATGREKGSAAAVVELAEKMGTGPNTNPYYQADKVGDTYESYDFDDLEDGSENNRDLTAGTAAVEDGKLVLSEDNSYVSTPMDKLGNGNELSFDITLTEVPQAGDIIFETTPEYGTHDIRIMEDGRLGFTRELHNYYFDYELPVGKTVNIRIVSEQQDTTLYVDGVLIGEASGKFIHNDMVKKEGITHSTFALPLERIGSETNAIAAEIDNVQVKEAVAEEPTDKSGWTGTADTETVYNETEGLFRYAFDNNPSSIWHSNWQGASDKLTGSNTFTGEIDFGQAYTINQFSFTPRTPQDSGRVTKADLYVKANAEDEWKLVAEDKTFANDATKKTFWFDEQEVRYVKFVAKESSDGWVAVSEFDIANIPQPTYVVYTQAEGNGTVSEGCEANSGEEVTVTATADVEQEACNTFAGWYNQLGEKVSDEAEYTFVPTKNTILIAKFEVKHTEIIKGKVEATCTEAGYTGDKVCEVCEAEIEKGEAVEATGHTFAEGWSKDATDHWKVCTVEGCEGIAEKAAHTYGEWKETKAPTCTEAGERTRVCSVCEEVQTEVMDKLAHKMDAGTVTKEATCETAGVKTFKCTNADCTYSTEEAVAKLEHKMDAGTVTKEATCGAAGVKTFKCTNAGCTHSTEEAIAQLPTHTWDAGKVTTEPTTKAEGVKTYTCNVCKTTKTEAIPALKEEAKTELPKKNSKVKVNGVTYKVTKPAKRNGTVSFAKPKTNATNVVIPATVKIKGVTYKVTAIEANAFKNNKKVKNITVGTNVTKIGATAFSNCKNLKKITFKTTKLVKKSIAKTAFRAIKKSTKIVVNKKKVNAYKTMFRSKGLSKTVKVTK